MFSSFTKWPYPPTRRMSLGFGSLFWYLQTYASDLLVAYSRNDETLCQKHALLDRNNLANYRNVIPFVCANNVSRVSLSYTPHSKPAHTRGIVWGAPRRVYPHKPWRVPWLTQPKSYVITAGFGCFISLTKLSLSTLSSITSSWSIESIQSG